MTCAEAREQMLIADPDDLAAGSSELASHLAGCHQCRRAAATIAGGTHALGAALRERRTATMRRRVRRTTWAAVPAAAAAAVIAVALHDRSATPPTVPAHADRLPVARTVQVDIAHGQQATVLKTADPNVTLIWFSPGVGQ